MSHFSLVSLPVAPEDTHEESVRHTVVSTFSLKKKKKGLAESKPSSQERNLLAALDFARRGKSVQLHLGATATQRFLQYTLSVPSQCVDAKVG